MFQYSKALAKPDPLSSGFMREDVRSAREPVPSRVNCATVGQGCSERRLTLATA